MFIYVIIIDSKIPNIKESIHFYIINKLWEMKYQLSAIVAMIRKKVT
jgi:hypothetical protein